MKLPAEAVRRPDSDAGVAADKRKLRLLWFGAALYFLVFLNALRYTGRVPWQAFVLGSLLNIAIIAAVALAMRRIYRRLREGAKEG